ncbi:MAG: extracellular solute-binding protein [Chloroflexia bacterium]|nr:extracellular solute-binding protein [Chloroflexia bacterium]
MTAGTNNRIDTPRISRRDALRFAGGAGLAATLAGHPSSTTAQDGADAITIPDTGAQLPSEDVTFRWVDSGDVKAFFWEAFFPKYQEAHPNITVQYDGLPWNEIGQIVPIGVQNGNAHDVFQVPLNIPSAQAVAEGWVAPLDDIIPNFAAWKAAFPAGAFVPGITDFNGKTYTVPLTSNKRYGTLTLYNVEYMNQAGFDPMNEPLTWDTFREAARKITEQGQGQYFGLIFEGSQTPRFGAFVSGLGRMAGAPSGSGAAGVDDIDWRTGEYVYTSDQYLGALDLLLAIDDDGSVFPGSMSLNAPQARAQMPQGAAGMILQGPWNIPQWQRDNPDFEFGVGSQPLPNTGAAVPMTVGPGGANNLWVYAQSPYQAVAGDIFAYVGSLEGQRAWASIVSVADPPIFVEAQGATGENPLAAKAFELFNEQLRLGPDPRVRNPDAAQVFLELQPISPDFGTVVQGVFTGQLEDPKAAMEDLQNRASQELDRAIKAAQDKGAQVSRDDWVFSNWDPTRDYTEADYAALGG